MELLCWKETSAPLILCQVAHLGITEDIILLQVLLCLNSAHIVAAFTVSQVTSSTFGAAIRIAFPPWPTTYTIFAYNMTISYSPDGTPISNII